MLCTTCIVSVCSRIQKEMLCNHKSSICFAPQVFFAL
ncbi:unnamed protein product [Arabidopsis halleri]